MITLGIVLLVVSMLTTIAILQSLGVLLIVVGVIFFLLGSTGRAVGGDDETTGNLEIFARYSEQ